MEVTLENGLTANTGRGPGHLFRTLHSMSSLRHSPFNSLGLPDGTVPQADDLYRLGPTCTFAVVVQHGVGIPVGVHFQTKIPLP